MNMLFQTEILDHTRFVPIGDKVLLALPREDVNEMVNVGGILQPKALADRNNPQRESPALAVGPECKQVERGDIVLWNYKNYTGIPRGEHDLYFVPESNLVCITKKAANDAPRSLGPLDVSKALAGAPDEGSS